MAARYIIAIEIARRIQNQMGGGYSQVIILFGKGN
jgi:hypothetical protein